MKKNYLLALIVLFSFSGCDTAKSVLQLYNEELERRTDLEKETIEEVKKILKEEFEAE